MTSFDKWLSLQVKKKRTLSVDYDILKAIYDEPDDSWQIKALLETILQFEYSKFTEAEYQKGKDDGTILDFDS
jgi:hypothetical protein